MMKHLLVASVLLAIACDRPKPEAAVETPAPPAAAAVVQRERLASDRIYYNLTSYGWYARGEPLVRDGVDYQPAGMPLALPLRELERAGEYEGVEYYRRAGDAEHVYVPVFDGYWLAFRASVSAAAD